MASASSDAAIARGSDSIIDIEARASPEHVLGMGDVVVDVNDGGEDSGGGGDDDDGNGDDNHYHGEHPKYDYPVTDNTRQILKCDPEIMIRIAKNRNRPRSPNPSVSSPISISDASTISISASPGYYQKMTTFMCPEMYRAVTSGDMTYFEKPTEDHPQFSLDQVSPRGNTILHIAARLRHNQLVEWIQKRRQELVKAKNRTGDTPLHVAASAGHLSTVEILLPVCRQVVVANGDPTESSEEQPLRMKNDEGNTPLHVALKNLYEKVAHVLIDADPEVSYYPNEEGKSPLYLAVEAGYVELVELMMKKQSAISDISEKKEKSIVHAAITSKNKDVLKPILMSESESEGESDDESNIPPKKKGKSIVHAAITSKNIDVLKAILTSESEGENDWRDDLLEEEDDEGLTPLSYAASTGYLDGVQYILKKFPKCAYISNKNGRFPIHVASSKGHIKIIEEFLNYCPDSIEMLTNRNGRNILHVAAKAGKARAVRLMLKMQELEMLINERDKKGNTPLHLAWDKRILDISTNYSKEDYQETTTFMCSEMYRAVSSGDMTYFKKPTEDHPQFSWDQVSPRGNTILHIAASLRHDQLVELIQKRRQELVKAKNRTGDTPLHVAASAGHLSTVEILLPVCRQVAVARDSNTNGDDRTDQCSEEQPLRMKNDEKNTPLHVALKNRYKEVARVLINADPEVLHYLNKEEKSPLYLATEAGYVELVELIMTENSPTLTSKGEGEGKGEDEGDNEDESESEWGESFISEKKRKSIVHAAITSENIDVLKAILMSEGKSNISPEKKGKSIVHAAITSKNIDVLKAILMSEGENDRQDDLLKAKDDEGLTPLFYAASTGYLDGVQYILKEFPKCAYRSNKYGRFPIHVASSKGHINIIKEFLNYCPDSVEMLTNEDGMNILHIAAKAGKATAVRHMLKMPELKMLINERDRRGNTPLHLASEGAHPKVVSILTWDKSVDLNLLNYGGDTALDIIATDINNSCEIPSFRERLTWQALRYVGAQQRSKPHRREPHIREPRKMDNYKDRVNTLMLVATLITTVTFAAGFTMPGGYSSSEPHLGKANFIERRMFHAFLISNTIAMYSSITVVVALIWAQLGDLNLLRASLKLTVPLLGISLTMVSVAFMTGIYLVVSSLYWLANVILIMGSVFLFILLLLFLPLFSPTSLHHTIQRYVFYFPFRLLIIVTRSDAEERRSLRFISNLEK